VVWSTESRLRPEDQHDLTRGSSASECCHRLRPWQRSRPRRTTTAMGVLANSAECSKPMRLNARLAR